MSNELAAQVGRGLHAARTYRNLSVADLTAPAAIGRSAYGAYLAGRACPSLETLVVLLGRLDVTFEQLLELGRLDVPDPRSSIREQAALVLREAVAV
ncbi:helix-turn-helix domain-containing protein [Streptomyces sp. NPDC059443]|uniref:helix-turn-helix domain-containing protein n=1 Tax=unclassified Streptomyces TaxID=2593676 RepID=UPI003697B95F